MAEVLSIVLELNQILDTLEIQGKKYFSRSLKEENRKVI